MNNQNLELLNSLIEKTKSNSIHWKPLSSCPVDIKTEKGHNSNLNISDTAINAITFQQVNKSLSYFVHYKDGYIFLLLKDSFANLEKTTISLVVQTELSNNSMEYATTQDKDNQVIASLKRLYNIVDSYDYDIASFVNDFIND